MSGWPRLSASRGSAALKAAPSAPNISNPLTPRSRRVLRLQRQNTKRVVGVTASTKGLYARPAASGCGGSHCVARCRLASFRYPPRSCVVMQGRAAPVCSGVQSAAGRRLRALCHPHGQNPRPPHKQVVPRSRVGIKNRVT